MAALVEQKVINVADRLSSVVGNRVADELAGEPLLCRLERDELILGLLCEAGR